jgi:hypothetical protein
MPSQAQPVHVITVDNTPAKAKEFLAGLIKVYDIKNLNWYQIANI